jgi:hypothetical protein
MGLKGYRLWAMGQLDSTCRAPPRQLLRLQLQLGRRVLPQHEARGGERGEGDGDEGLATVFTFA